MTKFIEVIDTDSCIILINVSEISYIYENKDRENLFSHSEITLKSDHSHVVKETIQEIKDLIQQAEQENPYRTK